MFRFTTFEGWLNLGILALVLLAGALAMSPSVADPDLWGHVQFGREYLETGVLAETDPYSYTANGFRWINHENLSEIVMAWTVDQLGHQALLYGKLALALFVLGLIAWVNIRNRVGIVSTSILVLLVAWNLGYHWSFRPQVSSFVLFASLLFILQISFSNWRDRWHLKWPACLGRGDHGGELKQSWFQARFLWFAPVVLLLWTNSHGGFVAGVCIYIAYLGCRALEVVVTRGRASLGMLLRMGLMILVGGLVVFVNPYSYRLPVWLIESLGIPRPEISDWSSDMLLSGIGLKYWVLVGTAFAAVALSKRGLDFTHTVLLGLTLWQSISHFRHVPFFAIACGFWVGPHLHSALQRIMAPDADSKKQLTDTWRGRLAVASVLTLLIVGLLFPLSGRMSEIRVERNVFPVDAFEFMGEHDLNGRMVVTYDWAQYAIAAFCVKDDRYDSFPPDVDVSCVAFDGRFRTCYPQEIVDMHFDFLFGEGNGVDRERSPNSGPCDPGRGLRYGNPDLVVLRRRSELSERHMQNYRETWVLLYEDGISQVWGKRTKFDNPASRDYLPPQLRRIGLPVPTGHVAWPALPKLNIARERQLSPSIAHDPLVWSSNGAPAQDE